MARKKSKRVKVGTQELLELLAMAWTHQGAALQDRLRENWPEKKWPETFAPPAQEKRKATETPAPEAKRIKTVLGPLQLQDPHEKVGTEDFVFNTVWDLVTRLHSARPKHPMFREQQQGIVR